MVGAVRAIGSSFAGQWIVPPYSSLAARYDAALGRASFIRSRKSLEFLVRRYGIEFRSAADLGCGTGIFACYLARRWGVPVWGIDRSPEMLAVAACSCREPGVAFLLQDIRCLRLPVRVDLATANFDALNHLIEPGDLLRAFENIHANLAPGGHLIFDALTHRQPMIGNSTYVVRFPDAWGGVIQKIHWDPGRRLFSELIIQRWRDDLPPIVEPHLERGYSPEELGRWLLGAGFVIRGVHDAATLRSADDCPSRIIVVARKMDERSSHTIGF